MPLSSVKIKYTRQIQSSSIYSLEYNKVVISGVSVTYERDMTEFLQEALLMKDLRHPNIIHLYGVVIFNYAPFVVFEYMDSGDLRSYIKKDKVM